MPALVNRYELGDILYSDADVVAYRGLDQLLNRAVTVAMLQAQRANDPAYVQRLIDKARNAALSGLPNVAALYDQHIVDGRPFLVLEEPAGPPLSAAGPLSPEQAIELVCALAATVQTAVSRQQPIPVLNEQTVRVGVEGRFQILDLGLQHDLQHQQQAVARLGHLLNIAVTGTPEGGDGTPLRNIVEQAMNGSCATPEVLIAQIQAIRHRADQPTMVLSLAPPTVVIPDATHQPNRRATTTPTPPSSVQAMAVEAAPAPAQRKFPLWAILGAGGLVLLLILGSSLLRGGDATADEPSSSTGASAGASVAAGGQAASAPAGELYVVAARGQPTVRVRNGPSTSAAQLGSLPNGTVVEVIGGPQPADGYTWVQIRAEGITGWCIREALRKQ